MNTSFRIRRLLAMKVCFLSCFLIIGLCTADAQTTWVTSIIDSDDGDDSSIAIDSNNKLHISYYDRTNGGLKYATNTYGPWQILTIDGIGGMVGWDTSIVIDSENKIHISYSDVAKGGIKYTTNASGPWQNLTVDSTRYVGAGHYASITVDLNNKLHISYYDYDETNKNLKYATNTSGAWITSTIDSRDVGLYSSIAIDSKNRLHISYYDRINRDLKYATNASGSWQTSTIDHRGDVGVDTSIAVDSNNKIHISYSDRTKGDLKYATNAHKRKESEKDGMYPKKMDNKSLQ